MIDTGGWYKLCCPTSQLAKPDVLGAVYRVRRKGAPKVDDPCGRRVNWTALKPEQLAGYLGDERPWVAQRAAARLAKAGEEAVPALAGAVKSALSAEVRRDAVWALARLPGEAAREAVRRALADGVQEVSQAAIHSISVWRDKGALPRLLHLLKCQVPTEHLRRAAAEAVGRIGKKSAVPDLLAAAEAKGVDRILEHSLIYALIEIGDREGTARGLAASLPGARRAALIALDQMEGGGLKPEQVTAHLADGDPLLQETAWWIAGRHPEWGEALAGYFQERLKQGEPSGSGPADLEPHLVRFAGSAAIQQLISATLQDSATPRSSRLLALRAMARSGLKEMPAAWAVALAPMLGAKDEEIIRQAVSAARALPPAKEAAGPIKKALLRLARDGAAGEAARLEALAAAPGGLEAIEPALFDFLTGHLDSAQPVPRRGAAAETLARSQLSREQLLQLAGLMESLGPLEVARLVTVFEKAADEAVGLKLVAALKESAGLSSLRVDIVKPLLAKYPMPVQKEGEALLERLNEDAAQQAAHLEELLASLKGGDLRRGQAIFNSSKAACSACHAIGYLGGNVGPDLTNIGQIRTERDLLEAVVYPSASLVRSYESVLLLTRKNQVHNGLIRKESAEEIILATGPNAEERVARADIAEIRPSAVSVMPQGLDQQISRQELADLIAFLKATKWGS